MENPRSIDRFVLAPLLTLLGVATVAALGTGVYLREWDIVLEWLVSVAGLVGFCGLLGILNAALFGPIFWLMSRMADRKAGDGNRISPPRRD